MFEEIISKWLVVFKNGGVRSLAGSEKSVPSIQRWEETKKQANLHELNVTWNNNKLKLTNN